MRQAFFRQMSIGITCQLYTLFRHSPNISPIRQSTILSILGRWKGSLKVEPFVDGIVGRPSRRNSRECLGHRSIRCVFSYLVYRDQSIYLAIAASIIAAASSTMGISDSTRFARGDLTPPRSSPSRFLSTAFIIAYILPLPEQSL